MIGCLTAGVALSAFAFEWYTHGSVARARSATFSVLVIEELLRAFSARSTVKTIWQVGVFSNPRLVLVVIASFALQLAIFYLPALQRLFGTAPVALRQWVVWIALGAVPLTVLELRKRMRRGQRPAGGAYGA